MRLFAWSLCVTVLLSACGDGDPAGNQNQNQGNNNSQALCGDGLRTGGEECDDGPSNSDSIPDACRTDCTLAHCGDSVVDEGEECDDGPRNSAVVPDACRPGCTFPSCGDGIVDVGAGEWCDCGDPALPTATHCVHPNGHAEGTCGVTCQVYICGNGVKDPGEACDDGNILSGDGCSANCQSDETCGNGVVDAATEDCDDGGTSNHDGCHSLCAAERPAWRNWPVFVPGRAAHSAAYLGKVERLVLFGGETRPTTVELAGSDWASVETLDSPMARFASAMIYDGTRDRVVLYGGYFGQSLLADTWEYDGVNWSRIATAELPGALAGHALAWDSARGRIVLFGGLAPGGARGETWEYDGAAWVAVSTAHAPPPRFNHRLSYDPLRGRVVLFGGCDSLSVLGLCNGATLGDTWEYDGVDWLQMTPASSPSARSGHGMAWDTSRGSILLFGGRAPGGALGDLWAYDGATWSMLTAPGGPSARAGHAMAYDPKEDRVLVQGGCAVFRDGPNPCVGAALEDTWALSGTAWSNLTVPSPLLARVFAGVARDGRGRLVLHGGSDSLGTRSDTWEFGQGAWVPGAQGGPAVSGHAMAYDPIRDRVVLFGGCQAFRMHALDICQSNGELGDTWEYDGYTWEQRSPAQSPPARYWHGMVFDESRGKILVHGGMVELDVNMSQVYSDTWEYDGISWALVNTTTNPPPTVLASLSFDRARSVTVRAGGIGASMTFETWELDSTDWTNRSFTATPAMRLGQLLMYDDNRQVHVLFGGCTKLEFQGLFFLECPVPLDDTWEYDGQQWTPLGVTTWPEARLGAAGSFDPELRGVVLSGGSDGVSVYYADVWRYRFDSLFTDERCDNGSDDDGDGLADCADPDCEGLACQDGLCSGGSCVSP
ncbi:MAG: kelch repeat-containing protein [Polyangia bacterium]|jgi:cysteine-rich repeat protein|nr:kelch repeat-containing protein [Polyangia bacterium]